MGLKQKYVNGLTLLGIGMTSVGLFEIATGTTKWLLAFAAVLLVLLGLYEMLSKD